MSGEDFVKAFAVLFGRQDAAGLAGLLAKDADVLTLTGAAAEGSEEARALMASEFAGIFAGAKLVKGKFRQRLLGPVTVVTQRFVVSGARDAQGQEMPRIGALLTAVLAGDGRAVSLVFSAVE